MNTLLNLSHKTKVTLRTIVQTIVGVALVAPIVVDQVGGGEAAGWLAGVVVISGVVTRFMASELGQKLTGFLNTADADPAIAPVAPAPPVPPVPPVS